MLRFQFILTLCLLTSVSQAQYEAAANIALPTKFDGMRQINIISSNPNPNWPEFESTPDAYIVWKHSTTISATENLKIIETGAYLLNNGAWSLRASFKPRETKKMFATKSLKLKKGDNITFQENWRYGSYTQTGINFWYVIAKTQSGELIFSYEIFETKGVMKDGTEVLPLIKSTAIINWTGKAGDSDYTLSGTVKPEMGKFTIIGGNKPQSGKLKIDLRTIKSEYDALTNHLQSTDFFDTKKFPFATYNLTSVNALGENNFEFIGELSFLGKTIPQIFIGTIDYEPKKISVNLKSASINRVDYGMNYASSVDNENTEYSISDQFTITANLSFKRDYPGSTPWNTLSVP